MGRGPTPRIVLGLALACACTKPRTEIVVAVRATLPTALVAALRVTVRDDGPAGAVRSDQSRAMGGDADAWQLPMQFGLIPADPDAPGRVWLQVSVCASLADCQADRATVVQRAVLTYRKGETWAYDLWLTEDCALSRVRCATDARCVAGACEPATRADDALRPYPGDAGGPPGASDAGDAGDASDAGDVGWVQRSCVPEVAGCGVEVIPAGTFTMGSDAPCGDAGVDDPGCAVEGSPAIPSVTVSAFVVDRYEVTVARFRAFWAAHARDHASIRARPVAYPNGASIAWTGRDAQEPYFTATDPYNWSRAPRDAPERREEHPVNGVDWWTALEFCVWDGGRLPTEAEWEYVARGRAIDGLTAGRVYATGDDLPNDCSTAVFLGDSVMCNGEDGARTFRVGHFAPSGGVYDLTGNLSEWTADVFAPYGVGPCWDRASPGDPMCLDAGTAAASAERTRRGGDWGASRGPALHAASRAHFDPRPNAHYVIGIRCVRSLR